MGGPSRMLFRSQSAGDARKRSPGPAREPATLTVSRESLSRNARKRAGKLDSRPGGIQAGRAAFLARSATGKAAASHLPDFDPPI